MHTSTVSALASVAILFFLFSPSFLIYFPGVGARWVVSCRLRLRLRLGLDLGVRVSLHDYTALDWG